MEVQEEKKIKVGRWFFYSWGDRTGTLNWHNCLAFGTFEEIRPSSNNFVLEVTRQDGQQRTIGNG